MEIEKVLKIREHLKEEKVRELNSINQEIYQINELMENLEKRIEQVSDMLKKDFSYELLVEERALIYKLKQLEKSLNALLEKRERKADELKEEYREIKSLERIKSNMDRENYRKESMVEQINLNFLYNIKRNMIFFLLFFLPPLSFAESALSKKIKQEQSNRVQKDLEIMSEKLEIKLKKIQEERKKLESEKAKFEELKRKEDRKDVEKWIAVINKVSPDEAGAMMNELEPELVAQIMLRLKERQAAQILEAMDPKKSAQVSKIIMESKKPIVGSQ